MPYKPLFIIYVTVKGLLKGYTVVQKESTSVKKWEWHMHTKL